MVKRVETPKQYVWAGNQNRYWYNAKWTRYYTFPEGGESEPQILERTLGTVTRVANTKAEYFNRWFAVLYGPPEIKSEPMLSRDSAQRWLEVIERMNR